ncbi:MAG TPA: hypothetical protein VMH26_12520 [Burkholderiales bacterium]|nr:hypothetical protein [Burkholderiales bacterium]
MNKLIGTLTAGVLALAVSEFAYAADEPQPGTQGQPRAEQNQPGQPGDSAKREQEYQTALKRCESLGAPDKQKCIDAAKKKYGEM